MSIAETISWQKTLKESVSFRDIGLHSGKPVHMRVLPAAVDHGLVFVKTHRQNHRIRVNIQDVTGIPRGSNLSDGKETLHTIEHFMAAVGALGLTNLEIQIDADEPPILDGSAIQFYEAFVKAGLVQQEKQRPIWKVVKPCVLEEGGAILMAYPSHSFSISYTLEYPGTFIGLQHIDADLESISLEENLLKARTFCLYDEVELLKARGQALGGSLQNAIVVSRDGCMNPEGLRFEKEFTWHKILDFYGDVSVLQGLVRGKFLGIRSGHRQNIGLIRKMLETKCLIQDNPWVSKETLEFEDIKKVIPHRYPFLLVDRIISLKVGESATGLKNVTGNEEFFNGHFPDTPVMPGVLIVEALAQVAGVCLLSMTNNQGKTPFFMGLDQIKFRRPVVPGDQLELSIQVLKLRGNTGKVEAKACVSGHVHVEGVLSFFIK